MGEVRSSRGGWGRHKPKQEGVVKREVAIGDQKDLRMAPMLCDGLL